MALVTTHNFLQMKMKRARVTCCSTSVPSPLKSRTQRIMESISVGEEAGGAGGASSYQALKKLDELWLRLRSPSLGANERVSEVVSRHVDAEHQSKDVHLRDVVVCGGTLGIFYAAALALKGINVTIVEKSVLRGRLQEWNISRSELMEIVHVGLITPDELDEIISIEFNPNRCGFDRGSEVWVENILNLGISPAILIEKVKQRFLDAGGILIEGAGVSKIDVFDNAAVVILDDGRSLSCKLVLDAMGNFSPIVRQIKHNQRPDGICLVVGTCARGFSKNTTSDVIYTNSPVVKDTQYFWEAFPAGSGPQDRTVYLFSYMDATPNRPSLEDLLEDYWDRMPEYQDVTLENLQVLRVLFGIFPTYRNSPLAAAFDRVLQVGDASGIQSPVSFGGFGSVTRHVRRLSQGIAEAIQLNKVDKSSLALLNPYMPNLRASWLLQKAMSVQINNNVSSTFINELLDVTFQCMKRLGDPVLRPFLQDVIQFTPFAITLGSIMLSKPTLIPQILRQVGFASLFDWSIHFVNLGTYTILLRLLEGPATELGKKLSADERFALRRRVEAWKYGAGLDYSDSNARR